MNAAQRQEKLRNIRKQIRANLYTPKLLQMVECIEAKTESPYQKFSDYGTYQRHIMRLRAKEQGLINQAISKLDKAILQEVTQ